MIESQLKGNSLKIRRNSVKERLERKSVRVMLVLTRSEERRVGKEC